VISKSAFCQPGFPVFLVPLPLRLKNLFLLSSVSRQRLGAGQMSHILGDAKALANMHPASSLVVLVLPKTSMFRINPPFLDKTNLKPPIGWPFSNELALELNDKKPPMNE
jgi:hypothetical protein